MALNLGTKAAAARRQVTRKADSVRPVVHGLSKVDAALLGAALVILGERVNSASSDGRLRALPGGIEPVNADQNFELSLSSLRSANAEVSLLSSLVSNVRKNVSEELSVSKAAQAVGEAYPRGSKLSADLEQYLADAGRPVSATELGVDGGANISGKSYINEMESLEAASQEFLNIMRQLFAEELDSVAERQQQEPAEEEQKEVAKEETEKPADGELEQEVADAGGFGSPWLGLLGLAAGGGGGGGGLSIGGSGFSIGGAAIDGYVSGATVFWDINNNWEMDANEAAYSTTTDASGNYSLTGITAGVGQIVIMDDGIDTSTGGSVGMMAMGTANASDASNAHVTPLTMLAAYGVTDEMLAEMLYEEHDDGDIDLSEIDFHSFDPVEVLEAGAGDAETGGVILLKAQQVFAIINAVSGLLEEAGSTQADAVASTISALANLGATDLRSLVGELSTDADIAASNTVLSTLLASVAPDFADVSVTDSDDADGDGDTADTITLAQKLASAITETNSVIGAEIADPELALEESARAAALITQNDLVTEFKEIGKLDPTTAAADIASKISASFSDAESIKAGFHEAYKSQIGDSLDAQGGITTAVDDVTVTAGQGRLIAVSDIIANDTSTGSGDLVMVSVSPANLTYTAMSSGFEKILIRGEPGASVKVFDNGVDITSKSQVVESLDSPGTYAVTLYSLAAKAAGAPPPLLTAVVTDALGVETPVSDIEYDYELHVPDPSAWTVGDYVRMDIGPIKVETRYNPGDDPGSVAARLVDEARATLKADNAPFSIGIDPDRPHVLVIKDRSGAPLRDRKTGESEVLLEKATDPYAGSHFGAQLVTIDGVDYIQVNSDKASSVRLKYTLANDDGQGHGLIRLTVEPDFGELATPVDRTTSVLEDAYTYVDGTKYSEIALGSQFEILSSTHSNDVIQERLIFKLDASMPDGCKLKLADGSLVAITKGSSGNYKGISINGDDPPSLLLPTNFHGDASFSFALHSRVDTSDGAVFTDSSEITNLTVSVAPTAEAPSDQSIVQIFIGDDATAAGDLDSAIVPVYGVPDPSSTDFEERQSTRLKLTGGDPNETHSVTFYNVPDGMSVYFGDDEAPVTVQFGSFTLSDLEIESEISIRFEASEALLGSQFGLTDSSDPIRAVVTGREEDTSGAVIDSADGDEVTFRFDIGGAYGLTITSQALTVSDEDVAALLGSLDASIGDGAQLESVITLNDSSAQLGRYVDGIFSPFTFSGDQATDTVTRTDGSDTQITITRQTAADGSVAYTLFAEDSATAAVYLENLAVLPGSQHFKGSLTASAKFTASMDVTDDNGDVIATQQLASLSKGPLTLRFVPVPDGIVGNQYDAPESALTAQEDNSIALAGLFLSSGETIAQKIDAGETLVYSVTGLPDEARLVDGSGFDGLSGSALATAIAEAPLIGRVVGNAVELTTSQAADAHIVVAADLHLDTSTLDLAAFTREPTTGEESSSATDTVDISITAVADTPYVSFDSDYQTRGLVNVAAESGSGSYLDELGLADKAYINLPVTMALEDLDGSESLWVWVTPYAYEADGTTVSATASPSEDFFFDTSALGGELHGIDPVTGAFVVKASELDSVSVSRSSNYDVSNGFDGIFRVEAIAIEKEVGQSNPPQTASDAITARSGRNEGVDYAVTTADLKVEFLQPATKPIVTLQTTEVTDALEITLTIGPDDVTDIVTVLATGVPTGSSFVDANGDAIGARAEVDGVWVFPSSVFGATVTLKLPPNYDGLSTADFTAYAVDSLGLTSASSDTLEFTPAVVTGASVADPIVIDVDGDGVDFATLSGTDTDGQPAQFFDIDGDGSVDRLTGWLSPSGDDAFLIALEKNGEGIPQLPISMDGSYLFTEHLVSPATTNAAEDLVSFEGTHGDGDGWLTGSEIEAGLSRSPFLWFDRNTDGQLTTDEIQSVSDDFALNVSGFDDVVVVDSLTGALVVASTDPGSIIGSYSDANEALSGSVIRDVFFPVAPADQSSSVVVMTDEANLSGEGFTEDNPDGFELKAALADPTTGSSWHDLFGPAAAAAIDSGTSVLLSVRAKNAGTYFNLSQGARLEGQPTDTWLTIWDGQTPSDEFSLRMFVDDNFSGDVPLELRATVVYTEGGAINEATVTRDLTISVAAQADRAKISTPDATITTDSDGLTLAEDGSGELLVSLPGIVATSPDSGERVEVQVRTTADIADRVDLSLGGIRISAIADPDAAVPASGEADTRDWVYSLVGPIADGDLSAIVDQYAAGTFTFEMDVTTIDGDDSSTVAGPSFGFKVQPDAQPATVSLTSDGSVSEGKDNSGVLGFDITVTPQDTDGSEFISEVQLSFSLSGTVHPGTEDQISLEVDGVVYQVTETGGIYTATIPGDVMTPLVGDTVGAREASGQIKLPDYFDGTVDMSASATTVELTKITEQATGNSSTIITSVDPVSDGVAPDGLVTNGTTVLGGQSVTLAALADGDPDLIQIQTLDPDETVSIQISGIPTDATPRYRGVEVEDSSYNSTTGVWTLSGLTTVTTADGVTQVQGLEDYSLAISDLQTDFALSISATTQDDTAVVSNASTGTLYIDTKPLYSPELVDSTGASLTALTLNVNEDGSGVLSGANVLVGDQLNPNGTEIRLTLNTDLVPVSMTASVVGSSNVLVPATSAGIAVFTLTAAELARGIEFSVDPTEPGNKDVSGAFGSAISLQATTNYDAAGTKTSDVLVASVNIIPVVDGVSFNFNKTTIPVTMTEDGSGLALDTLFSFSDTSEVIDSLVVGQSSALVLRFADDTVVSLASGSYEIDSVQASSLSSIFLEPVPNANGPSRLQVTANVRDAGEDGVSSSSVSSQTTEIAVNIEGDNDAPVAVDDTLTVIEDSGQSLVDVLANDSDVDGDALTVSEVSTSGSGTVSIDGETGQIAYNPATNFYGTETITYKVSDGTLTDSATVTVTVTPVAEAPVLIPGSISVDEDSGVTQIDVIAGNAIDPDGDPLILVSVSTDGPGAASVNNNRIAYEPAQDFDGSETLTFVVTDGTTQVSSSFVVTVDPVFDALALDELQNPEDPAQLDGLLTIYADGDRTASISEAIVNDGRVDLGADITLFVSAGGFSTSDPSESASIAIGGQGVVAGSRLIISDGAHAGAYDATEIGIGIYEFVVPGIDGTVSSFDAEILIPKQNSGYGSKTLTVTTRVNDGYTTNEAITETEAFSIFSTIPPAPFVQLAADVDPASLDSGIIALDDLIRVEQGNDSHVIEIFGLPVGAEVLVGDQVQTEILFQSSYQARLETGFRVSFDDWDATTITLPESVIAGDELLSIGARVGTSDGTVNGATDGETRFVYSRLVETEISLSGGGTSVGDFLVNADGSAVSSGDGNDTVTVTGLGSGALDGGNGRDTLNLGQLSVADAAVVDLNLGSMTVITDGNADQSQIHRDIEGFETIIGTAGDDVIVGSGVDSESITLRGGLGADRINGGAGDDLIDGGAGDDQLHGGAGSDRFIVAPGVGSDTVTDFDFTADSIVISGFGLSPLDSGALPPEVSLERSAGDETDWMLRVTKTDSGSGQILTASVTLAGTATLVEADLLGQLTSPDAHAWVTYSETLDLAGSDPEASDPGYGIDLGLIVGDTTGYANSFFGALDYGDEYDQISGALGVIADAKFESALIARFTNQTQEVDQQSMDLSAYAGLSGSIGDDVLIGLDQDSVLYGGDGGSDRIIGGLGDDILIASGGNDTDDTFDELTGGAGADVFAFVNPGTVDAGLQNVHDVLVNDFNRGEGDRILLVGYDDLNDVLIHDVDTSTNTQRVSLEDGLSVMFDLSFSREFDSNFALRLADFDKFEG